MKEFRAWPVLEIDLVAEQAEVIFRPALDEARLELISCIRELVENNHCLPKVGGIAVIFYQLTAFNML